MLRVASTCSLLTVISLAVISLSVYIDARQPGDGRVHLNGRQIGDLDHGRILTFNGDIDETCAFGGLNSNVRSSDIQGDIAVIADILISVQVCSIQCQ